MISKEGKLGQISHLECRFYLIEFMRIPSSLVKVKGHFWSTGSHYEILVDIISQEGKF